MPERNVFKTFSVRKKGALFLIASLLFWEVLSPLASWTGTRKAEFFFLGFLIFLSFRFYCRNR